MYKVVREGYSYTLRFNLSPENNYKIILYSFSQPIETILKFRSSTVVQEYCVYKNLTIWRTNGPCYTIDL